MDGNYGQNQNWQDPNLNQQNQNWQDPSQNQQNQGWQDPYQNQQAQNWQDPYQNQQAPNWQDPYQNQPNQNWQDPNQNNYYNYNGQPGNGYPNVNGYPNPNMPNQGYANNGGYNNYAPNSYNGPIVVTNAVPASSKSGGLAIGSLVCGIISIIGFWSLITLIVAIVGAVLGIVNNAQENPNKGMAIAGIILNIIGFLLSLFFIVILIEI